MKKIDQNSNTSVLQFLSQLQLEQFSDLVESTYKDPEFLFNNIVNIIEPENREDLVAKAEIDLYSLSIEELVHLAYRLQLNFPSKTLILNLVKNLICSYELKNDIIKIFKY